MIRFELLVNLLRLKISFFLRKNIEIKVKQRISFSTLIKVEDDNSFININSYLHTRRNVTIHADGGNIVIGRHVFINENSSIISKEEIIINDNVSIGPNVMIYDHDHNILEGTGYVKASILIDSKVWIGANCVILKGVQIGSGSVIAAGTVLRKSVPPDTLVFNESKLVFKLLHD
jgi:acetyltransferase-like isoleucine patch superfamily enzyme